MNRGRSGAPGKIGHDAALMAQNEIGQVRLAGGGRLFGDAA
jgi:hypothetical protein